MDWLQVVGVVATSAVFGGMLFFTLVMTPLVFAHLPRETAANFMRAVFPIYYLAMAGVTAVAAASQVLRSRSDAFLLALVCATFLVLHQWVLPRTAKLRGRMQEGDEKAARPFARLHRLSVMINTVQIVIVTLVLVHITTGVRT